MQRRRIIIVGPYDGKPDLEREMYVSEWSKSCSVIDANALEVQYGRGVSSESRSRAVLGLISDLDARGDILVALGGSSRVRCESTCAKEMGLMTVASLSDVKDSEFRPVIQIVGPIARSPGRNWQRFGEQAEWLNTHGYRALDPLQLGKWESFPKRLTSISKVDACLLIVGWELDPESTIEVAAARRCGVPCVGEWERWKLARVVASYRQAASDEPVAVDRAVG